MNSLVSSASVVRLACSPVLTFASRGRISSICRTSSASRRVRLRGDGDLVEPALLLEQALRGRQVEARERRAADRQSGAELHDPGDASRCDRALLPARRCLTYLEVLIGRRLLVDNRPRPGPAT